MSGKRKIRTDAEMHDEEAALAPSLSAPEDFSRIVRADFSGEEDAQENKLRPQLLNEFLGQETTKKNLSVLIDAEGKRTVRLAYVMESPVWKPTYRIDAGSGTAEFQAWAIVDNSTDIDWNAPDGPAPRVFEGHASLVRLNHASERAVQYVTAVMEHWLARGIDGWRLDAAYSVDTGFWARVIPAIRDRHPNAWFLGEVIHGDHSRFVASSGVDATTQYELWKAIWSSIKDRNFFELDWALNRHNGFLAHFTPNTFIGNHDVTRIASVIGSDGAVMALAILLTLGGIPSIYYGDEQGFTGIKEERTGGDDAIRPAFPDTPSELADWGQNVHRAHQDLIGLRRRNPWLVTATTTPLHLENTRYTYRAAARDGSNHLDVAIDIAGTPSLVIKNASGHVLWEWRH